MPDKIVNHFVLADGSTAKYGAGDLLNLDDTVSLAGYAPDAKAVGDRLTDVEDLAETLNEGGLELKDDVIAVNVADWLDDHPEATTTVQDDSLTTAKYKDNSVTTAKLANGAVTSAKVDTSFLKTIENSYVTPEMFGAVGDGTTDDTRAWQEAVDVGLPVIAKSAQYKCGQINVTKNISIDCNNATFTCTASKLFNCYGTVTETVENAPDYVKNANYTLPNDNYTGFAMLKSTDNVITTRTYYYGGFATMFKDGICHAQKPVSFTGVTVEKVNPITCKIAKAGTVTHPNHPGYNYTVYCTYGYMCEFSHIEQIGEKYNVLFLENCLRCDIGYITGELSNTGSVSQYYGIELASTSECYTHDCNIISDWWHCWTTGSNYLCFDNIVKRCTFKVGTGGVALADHDNAIGTTVIDSDLDGAVLYGNSRIANTRIYSHLNNKGETRYGCAVCLYLTNLDGCNNFDVENIHYVVDENKVPNAGNLFGVVLVASGQTTGNHMYINDVKIKNLYSNYYTGDFSCVYYSPSASIAPTITCKGNWVLDNVVGRFRNLSPETQTNWDDCEIVVQNCERRGSEGFRVGINDADNFPMKLFTVRNSIIRITGVFKILKLENVRGYVQGSTLGNPSGTRLEATNIDRLANVTLLGFTNTEVTNMLYNENYIWAYVIHNSSFSVYGRVESTGIVNYTLS